MKICPKCGVEKPRTEFYKDRSKRDGLYSWCKPCVKDYATKRYANNPKKSRAKSKRSRVENRENVRQQNIRRRGMTPKSFDAMLASQGGVCAICRGVNQNSNRLSIDHDHNCCPKAQACSKCIRALLCISCNNGLGLFQDDPALLRKAADYLENYEWMNSLVPALENVYGQEVAHSFLRVFAKGDE